MWNHFSDFRENIGNDIVLRASIYNPRYMMPAQTTVKLKINYPPKKCELQVTPTKGIEFETKFAISVENCFDYNTTFSYQFWLYKN